MRKTLFLICFPVFAAIDRNPPGCSSRPCTYTLTCASALCDATENGELQTVLNEAHLGDTIRLQAGRTWVPGSSGYQITGRPGSGWLTITSTLADRLPLPGTRITPHYRGVMPTIRNNSAAARALVFPPSDTPAKNIKIVGVRFDAQANAQTLIRIGDNTSNPVGRTPENIVIDRCIVENSDWDTRVGLLVSIPGSGAQNVRIINSYLQGSIKKPNAEVQIISGQAGSWYVINNYMAENMGENMMLGGAQPDVDIEPYNYITGEIAHNVMINHRERVPHLAWQPRTRYFKSATVVYQGTNYKATNSGTSGDTFTTYDNGIQWVSFSGTPSSKNVFEIKTARDVKIHHNTFEGYWTQAQYEIIVFKVSNSSAPANCVPQFSGTVSTNGQEVTGGPLPDLWWGSNSDGSSCTININGTNYSIADFDPTNPNRVVLSASAGTQTNVPFSYGASGCKGAWLQNIAFEYNVIRKGPQAFQILSLNNARFSRVGNIRVRNNLMYEIDPQLYCMAGANCSMSKTSVYFSQIPFGVDFSNNTIVNARNIPEGFVWEGGYQCRGWCRTQSPCTEPNYYMPVAGDTRFASNIFPKGSSTTIRGATPSSTDSAVLSQKVCEGGCTREKWFGNILAGTSLSGWPAGTFNLCPTSSACSVNWDYDDPVYGKLFENYQEFNFKVRSQHYAARGGMYGRQIGADWEGLPIVIKPSTGGIGVDITSTGSTITLNYRVTAPQRHIPCVVEASTTPDIESGRIPDLDASIHLRPDVDGPANSLARSVTIGSRTPLQSGTTYFIRLHCGGAFWEGEATTQ